MFLMYLLKYKNRFYVFYSKIISYNYNYTLNIRHAVLYVTNFTLCSLNRSILHLFHSVDPSAFTVGIAVCFSYPKPFK